MTTTKALTKWRFLGSSSSIEGLVALNEFGQQIELPQDLDASALKVCCIPQKDFDGLGFTPEELNAYRYPGTHDSAPEEFKRKKLQALLILHKLREQKGV